MVLRIDLVEKELHEVLPCLLVQFVIQFAERTVVAVDVGFASYFSVSMNWWSKSTSYPSPSFNCPVDNRQFRSNVFSLSAVLKA